MHRILLLLLIASTLLVNAAETGGPPDSVPVAPPATGTTARPAQPDSPFGNLGMPLILGGLGLFMWLMVIRPQKREEKKRKELTSNVKIGHKVITIGGVHADVISVGETTVDLRLGTGDRAPVVTFNKSAILTNITLADSLTPAAK
jgi:preprotein translocase YajC subunit